MARGDEAKHGQSKSTSPHARSWIGVSSKTRLRARDCSMNYPSVGVSVRGAKKTSSRFITYVFLRVCISRSANSTGKLTLFLFFSFIGPESRQIPRCKTEAEHLLLPRSARRVAHSVAALGSLGGVAHVFSKPHRVIRYKDGERERAPKASAFFAAQAPQGP